KSLTIQPGTLIKGRAHGGVAENAAALIVSRGGKIFASGTETCPIVFTAEADNLDGTYPIGNVGKWGGIALLGQAQNCINGGENGNCIAAGLGVVEGFDVLNPYNWYGADINNSKGNGAEQFNDDDNSGIMRYVSIRHAGCEIAQGNELNGLSLASVGRGTTIENIEVISNDDDDIEIFGGTVNLRYITSMFGCDDMLDYDLGWNGTAQFIFGIHEPNNTNGNLWPGSSDNGLEGDGDDKNLTTTFDKTKRSNPTIYNATLVSNGNFTPTADNTGVAGIMAKDRTQGSIYNSVFVNFRSGLHLATNATEGNAYQNWSNTATELTLSIPNSLKVKNNTFIGCDMPMSIGALVSGKNATIQSVTPTAPSAADLTQFTTTDKNIVIPAGSLDPKFGFAYVWAMNTATNAVTTKYDVVPSSIAATVSGTANPFYSNEAAPQAKGMIPVAYRGAFAPTGKSWVSGWTLAKLLQTTAGLQNNPTDINQDGKTDVTDFNMLASKFGQANL
ncbi:MAG TPA: hypothetical protein P5243_08835, partial [Bacteroidales bacterium]|nr:hypothetical protein [Bacteroidales bacterium]